jgi:DNA repair protein RadC
MDLFLGVKQELFYCLYLNNKNYVIERKLLFMGTINRSVVHPREIFKNAYLCSASGIICIHNHPSGDVTPSLEDKRLTKALVDISRIQNIPILDHVIIGEDNYFSFMEKGLL